MSTINTSLVVKKGIKRKVTAVGEHEGHDSKTAKKGKTLVSRKKLKRKEVTTLYGDLINPGRKEKPEVLVEDILNVLETRSTPLHQYSCSEVGSRVLQACLKWGTKMQRRKLLTALKSHLAKNALDRYGYMVVIKLLSYCTKTSTGRKPSAVETKERSQNLKDFLGAFEGKALHRAFFHKYGCRVINSIYFSAAVNAREKRHLFHQIAIPPAILLTRPEVVGNRTLRQLLKSDVFSPEEQLSFLQHSAEVLEKVIDKELLSVDVVHILFQAYCEHASEAQLKETVSKCIAGLPYLLSSKPGAEAILRLLGVASAKEKKAFCRDIKGKFVALAMNPVDYVVMMRLASIVDDTVLLEKTMLQEWLAELAALCFDKYGVKVLAWLLRPGDARLFSPYERECLGLPAPSSLKTMEKRRQELLRTLRPCLYAVIQENILKVASDLYGKDLLLAYLDMDWDAVLLEALVSQLAAEAHNNGTDMGLLGSGTTTTTLLALMKIESGRFQRPSEVKSDWLAAALWKRCLEPRLVRAATSRCAFVLRGILRSGGETAMAARKALISCRGELEKAAKAVKACSSGSGAQSLLDALDGKTEKAS